MKVQSGLIQLLQQSLAGGVDFDVKHASVLQGLRLFDHFQIQQLIDHAVGCRCNLDHSLSYLAAGIWSGIFPTLRSVKTGFPSVLSGSFSGFAFESLEYSAEPLFVTVSGDGCDLLQSHISACNHLVQKLSGSVPHPLCIRTNA
jgi:hypothetical protein